MGLSICLFSLCIFLLSPLLLNCIKDAIEVIVVYKLVRDAVDFIDNVEAIPSFISLNILYLFIYRIVCWVILYSYCYHVFGIGRVYFFFQLSLFFKFLSASIFFNPNTPPTSNSFGCSIYSHIYTLTFTFSILIFTFFTCTLF